MRNVVITHAVRTPIGKFGGGLSKVEEHDMVAAVLKELITRSQIDPHIVDEVICGNVKQSTNIMNVARMGWLKAGLPSGVPGYSLTMACASGLESVFEAAQRIASEDADIIIAGGVENMSNCCYYLRNARKGFGNGDVPLKDSLTEGGGGAIPEQVYGDVSMGKTAENVAGLYNIDRKIQDEFAFLSQQRCNNSVKTGIFADEIITVGKCVKDEFPRETTMENLAKVPPAFTKNGSVTAGNSSGRNDGAAVVLVMSEEKAKALGYVPELKFVSGAASGLDPTIMGVGPVEASRAALQKAGLSMKDLTMIELNEAFASQSVAVIKEWASWGEETYEDILKKTNINGGAISLGHPLGATGAILLTKLLYALKKYQAGSYGMVTMCVGGGMGLACIFEKCKK